MALSVVQRGGERASLLSLRCGGVCQRRRLRVLALGSSVSGCAMRYGAVADVETLGGQTAASVGVASKTRGKEYQFVVQTVLVQRDDGPRTLLVVLAGFNTDSTQDSDQAHAASNVDDWLARFSPVAGSKLDVFPFTSHKTQSIESRRACMSDLLIFDVLLIRGGIRSPDMLFPPADWPSLRKLLDAIDDTVYDILKKDCLVYILLKWAWDMDPKETNPGWDARYLQERCIAPQFAALADAYWLLDTGAHLPVRPSFRTVPSFWFSDQPL